VMKKAILSMSLMYIVKHNGKGRQSFDQQRDQRGRQREGIFNHGDSKKSNSGLGAKDKCY
jgi:hypothetical protein